MNTDRGLLIFIVEDYRWYSEFLEYNISMNPDHHVKKFYNGKDCLANMYLKPDVITLDFRLPDTSGDKLLKEILEVNPQQKVVIISGQEDIKTAVNLLKVGAYDYIVKDDDTKERLWKSISNITSSELLIRENQLLKEQLGIKYDPRGGIIGKCNAMQEVFALIGKAVKSKIPVAVTGETGTGKEMVAKAIHYGSDRAKGPFIPVNMASIPSELVESELFGHEKGSFTGALNRRIGKFEQASGGTLFLDEIAEMDISLQAKLLRVLQEKVIVRIGSNKEIPIDIRVVIATHKNLQEEVKKGNFREDLYYRLLGLSIKLPPLRERDNDILILAKQFLVDFCKENKLSTKVISQKAQAKLLKHSFPGNVRELKAIIELAAVVANGDQILEDDIIFQKEDKGLDLFEEEHTMEEYTQMIIGHYLKRYHNKVLLVAEKLDISKSTIYNMLKDQKIKMTEN